MTKVSYEKAKKLLDEIFVPVSKTIEDEGKRKHYIEHVIYIIKDNVNEESFNRLTKEYIY